MSIKNIKAQGKENFKRNQSNFMVICFAAIIFLGVVSLITAMMGFFLFFGGLQVGIYYAFYRNSQGIDIIPQDALHGYKNRFGPAFVGGFVVGIISKLPQILQIFTFIASLLDMLSALGISGFGERSIYSRVGTTITVIMLILDVMCYVVTLSLSMSMYIMARDPEIDAFEALTLSRQIMHGHIVKYFLLRLSFIGWILLSFITFNLSRIYSDPYRYASEVVFFNNLYDEYFLKQHEKEFEVVE